MSLKGNKGEWSEVYVLFKLLGEKKVFSGDKDLNKIANLFYPILKILRDEQDRHLEYAIDGDIVVVDEDGTEVVTLPVSDFLAKANELLKAIKEGEGAFAVPSIEPFMNDIHCKRLKAKSKDKADIKLVIHDLRTGMTPLLGFSIKSQLGSPSTLLNAGIPTNFNFLIAGTELSDEEIDKINSINNKRKIRDRVKAIINKGGNLEYHSMQNDTFRNNLVLIDSCMPQIVAEILRISYSTEEVNIHKLVEVLTKENPLGFDMSSNHPYYEHKVKQLLVDIALGMTPATTWKGKYDANGGYLVVKDDGDVLCYHFYDRNLFEDYLFYNTKLESASTTRYNFAKIFKKDDEQFFTLNLQIRFY